MPADGLVLVNGPENSVQGPRARALFGDSARVVYKTRGRLGSVRPVWAALNDTPFSWLYCIDLGLPIAPLAALRMRNRRRGRPPFLIYELGDPGRPLSANQGAPAWKTALFHRLDLTLPPGADALVFRGSYLAEYFAQILQPRPLPRWTWIPDGADTDRFRPMRDDPRVLELRRCHGLEGRFVVGLVGSIHHNEHLGLVYGWDLAESLGHLPPDLPITGVVVGDGPGRPALERLAERFKLGDRFRLVGRVPHEEVPLWMNAFDVGLSTQTDDPVGWGRTTAKLPEYLACGLVIASTDVGEAHRWLSPSGQTLPYKGLRDDTYPPRLAEHLRRLLGQDLEPTRQANRALALEKFDYRILREQLAAFLDSLAPESQPAPASTA
jgi:glycosyltransferase involved in cell wall biosynthesis